MRFLPWIAVTVLTVGCTAAPRQSSDWDLARAHVARLGEALDTVARTHEEYGSLTLSHPLLVAPAEHLTFQLKDGGADKHYEAAKEQIQGAAASFDQAALALGLQAQVLSDPTMAAAYAAKLAQYESDRARIDRRDAIRDAAAKTEYDAAVAAAMQKQSPEREQAIAKAQRDYAANLSGPSAPAPQFPTAPEIGKPTDVPQEEGAGDTAASDKAASKFVVPGALIDKSKPATANRAALITAAGDTAVETIFRALGQPEKALAFKGKSVALGIAMVSVNPGWRTRRDHAGELLASMEFEYTDARPQVVSELLSGIQGCDGQMGAWRLSEACAAAVEGERADLVIDENKLAESPTKPSVAAVSPMTDVQALDLAAGERRRNELSLALALALTSAGMKAGADTFLNYMRERQRDIATRTLDVPISAFSAANMIGYQVGPLLRAVEDVRASKAAPGYVLERQTFPVLLMYAFDSADVLPYVVRKPVKDDRGQVRGFEYVVQEPYLRITQSNRWVPLTQAGVASRLKERDLLASALAIRDAHARAPDVSDETVKKGLDKVVGLADVRIESLHSLVYGVQYKSPLPFEFVVNARPTQTAAVVTDAVTARVVLARDPQGNIVPAPAKLRFIGGGLNGLDRTALKVVSGDLESAKVDEVTASTVAITATVRSDKEPIVFALVDRQRTRDAEARVLTPKVEVVAPVRVRPVMIRQVFPDNVELQKDDLGRVRPRAVTVTLIGDAFDRIDLAAVRVLTGRGRLVGAAKLVGEGSQGGGGGVQVEVEINGADEPLSLALDVQPDAVTPRATIVSPPVQITVK